MSLKKNKRSKNNNESTESRKSKREILDEPCIGDYEFPKTCEWCGSTNGVSDYCGLYNLCEICMDNT